jgi:hypothetical protein
MMFEKRKLYVSVLLMMVGLMACKQESQEQQDQEKTYEGLKKRIGKWTMIQNAGAESYVPFLLASRGISNADAEHGVLFVRHQDEEGQPIQAGRSYTIKGDTIKAASWSLSIYHGNQLVASRKQHYVTSHEVGSKKDAKWKIILSPSKAKNSPWLINSANQAGSPKIALRVYNPFPSFLDNFGKNQLPSIVSIK